MREPHWRLTACGGQPWPVGDPKAPTTWGRSEKACPFVKKNPWSSAETTASTALTFPGRMKRVGKGYGH